MFKKIVILLLVAVLALVLWMNRGWVNEHILTDGATSAPTISAAPMTLLPASASRYRFATIDPTASTLKSFSLDTKNALIKAVAESVPAKPSVQEQKKSGVAAISALELSLNLVTSLPLQTGQPNWRVHVLAVPGLPPQPDFLAPGATEVGGPLDQWRLLQVSWDTAYTEALASAVSAAAALQAVDLGIQENSSIAGAISSQLQLAPETGNASFFLASDLEENQGTQTSGSFHGAPLSIAAACPSGNAQECTTTWDTFTAWAKSLHVGTITRIDAGNLAPAITTWIGEQ